MALAVFEGNLIAIRIHAGYDCLARLSKKIRDSEWKASLVFHNNLWEDIEHDMGDLFD